MVIGFAAGATLDLADLVADPDADRSTILGRFQSDLSTQIIEPGRKALGGTSLSNALNFGLLNFLVSDKDEEDTPVTPPKFIDVRPDLQSIRTRGPQSLVAQQEGQGMGFFSSIAKFVGGAARSILGLGAQAVRPVSSVVRRAPIRSLAIGGGLVAGGALAVNSLGQSVDAEGDVVAGAMGGGNGMFSTVTTVTTINRATGAIVKQKQLKGSPFLMRRDLATARRVEKVLNKQAAKQRGRSRGPSKQKQLMDAVQDKALENVLVGAACAPKC